MAKKYTRRQLMVLLGASLFQCAMIGFLVNCSGVLFAQIRAELGFTMSKVSAYNTLKSVVTALAATTVTAFFFRANKVRFLFLNQVITIVSFLMLAVSAQGVMWYAAAILCGLASCVANVAVPMTLNQWFPENAGTAAGIAMAFSGIGGAVCNPLCARLIELAGWKLAIVFLSVLTLAFTIAGLHLMFREEPPKAEAAGPKAAAAAQTAEGGRASPGTLILVALVMLGGGVGVTFALSISMFAQSTGYSLTVGASMTTMVMIGNVGSKFLYGLLCDKIGTWKATLAGLALTAAALLCYLFASGQVVVLMAASLLYGCVYALSVVGMTRCCIAAYGEQGSKRYLGIHTCIGSIVMAATSMLVGILFDRAQSFTPVLLMVLGSIVCSAVAALLLMLRTRRRAGATAKQ